MLHLYSSPLGSVFNRVEDPLQGKQPAPRPSGHVLVTLFLPLLQITLVHTQGIWKRYSHQVIIPTSICGFIGMVIDLYIWRHFVNNSVGTLYLHYSDEKNLGLPSLASRPIVS